MKTIKQGNVTRTYDETKVKEFAHEEWLAEGKRRFGSDVLKWKVRCPMCGKVSSLQEFKDAGADGPDAAFVECIGRYTGQGSPNKATGKGCNWAAYGLFGIPRNDKYIVTFPDGHSVEVFPFADIETEGEQSA